MYDLVIYNILYIGGHKSQDCHMPNIFAFFMYYSLSSINDFLDKSKNKKMP